MSAEDGHHGGCPGLSDHAEGAFDHGFAAMHEQLFGLTQAAAGSSGKNDGGNSHGHQFTGKRLTLSASSFPVDQKRGSALIEPRNMSENDSMTDLQRILLLWRALEAEGADYVLCTVIAIEGSSYRKPGACMLLAPDGRRAGTVSGGCLEAEVIRRAWWHTAHGPSIQSYSTVGDDGERPYGSGCGGVVWLLLERAPTAAPLLNALEQAFRLRLPIAATTILEGELLGKRACAGLEQPVEPSFKEAGSLQGHAELALASKSSTEGRLPFAGTEVRVWSNYRPARPGLWIFGAGDDAQPLLQFGKALGWYVAVADGRSQLATRERFAAADETHVLTIAEMPAAHSEGRPAAFTHLRPQDAAVVMTHSFEQDARILATLLALDVQPIYIGVLGPRRRSRELLVEAARLLNSGCAPTISNMTKVEGWLAEIHAPIGLDLGARSPETIALSIVAEVQKSLSRATALPLSEGCAAASVLSGASCKTVFR
jgi:xanthine/CO dehydrogenase XdhC/CoxF family maturation factor